MFTCIDNKDNIESNIVGALLSNVFTSQRVGWTCRQLHQPAAKPTHDRHRNIRKSNNSNNHNNNNNMNSYNNNNRNSNKKYSNNSNSNSNRMHVDLLHVARRTPSIARCDTTPCCIIKP